MLSGSKICIGCRGFDALGMGKAGDYRSNEAIACAMCADKNYVVTGLRVVSTPACYRDTVAPCSHHDARETLG